MLCVETGDADVDSNTVEVGTSCKNCGCKAVSDTHFLYSFLIYEPRHEKTNILHMRKQRRRLALW